MIRLCDCANLAEAQLLIGLLARHGIAARLFHENLAGATGEIPFIETWPEIWLLDPADETRAREILRDYETTPAESGQVFCPVCKEANPGNFETCWKCGADLRGK